MRALILDFGGVISKTLFETHAQTEQALGLPANTLHWRGPFDPASDALWQSMQREEISERDYWLTRTREVAVLCNQNWAKMSDFVQAARGADPLAIIRPEALETIRWAKSNDIRLAILSNELDLFYGEKFREKCAFLDDFDCIVDATYTDLLKPDARAYAMVVEQLGGEPPAEQCLFVDDQMRNVQGADDYGMQTVHFDVTDPVQSYRFVRERLTRRNSYAVQ